MKVTITGRHMTVHDSVKTYAEQKAQKSQRYFDQLREVEIILRLRRRGRQEDGRDDRAFPGRASGSSGR